MSYPWETPGCVLCDGTIDFDNCDGDFREGRMVGYLGSSEAFKCESCGDWCHNRCGDPKNQLCRPCVEVPAA